MKIEDLIGYEIIRGERLPLSERKTVQLSDNIALSIISDRRIISIKKNIKVTEQVWPPSQSA